MRRVKDDLPFFLLWLAISIAGSVAGVVYLDIPWYLVVLIAINVSTFALYGLDKLLAMLSVRRVPERTLHFAAFFFGSPGALAAMQIFRHKTRKTSFQLVLALLVLLQVLLVLVAVYSYDSALLA